MRVIPKAKPFRELELKYLSKDKNRQTTPENSAKYGILLFFFDHLLTPAIYFRKEQQDLFPSSL